jgi:hypothetical protein
VLLRSLVVLLRPAAVVVRPEERQQQQVALHSPAEGRVSMVEVDQLAVAAVRAASGAWEGPVAGMRDDPWPRRRDGSFAGRVACGGRRGNWDSPVGTACGRSRVVAGGPAWDNRRVRHAACRAVECPCPCSD